MTVSSSTVSAVLFGGLILGLAWLVSDLMPPPWPCAYEELARHPKAQSLLAAARSACAAGDQTVRIELARTWPGEDWRRLHLLGPYHGNHEVVRRVGFDPAIMACTRSRNTDEWTQAVLEGRNGDLTSFDLPTHLLAEHPTSLERSRATLKLNCQAVPGGV